VCSNQGSAPIHNVMRGDHGALSGMVGVNQGNIQNITKSKWNKPGYHRAKAISGISSGKDYDISHNIVTGVNGQNLGLTRIVSGIARVLHDITVSPQGPHLEILR